MEDGGGGGIFKPQDTRLLEDRCKGCHKKIKKNPLKASLKWNNCRHTILGEEDDVVGDDPSVQGELCELLLQIFTGLCTAGWNTKLSGLVSESQCGYQGFIPGKLITSFVTNTCFILTHVFCKNFDFLVQIKTYCKACWGPETPRPSS